MDLENNTEPLNPLKRNNESNQYQCKYCDEMFLQEGDLRIHMALHNDDKQYGCCHCDKAFSQEIDPKKTHIDTQ